MSTSGRKKPAIYPGKTSTLSVGGTMLTFQTEVGGDPLTVTTIVVNRGRTVKVFRDLVTELRAGAPGLSVADCVTRAHQAVVGRLKVLTRVSPEARTPAPTPSTQPTIDRKTMARAEGPNAAKGQSDESEATPANDTVDARRMEDAKDAAGGAASLLVIKAVEAFDDFDHHAALNLLEAALSMLPGDPRIQRSIARLRELV